MIEMIKGFLSMIFSVVFAIVSWYIIPNIINILSDGMVNAILWAGYLVILVLVVIVKPVVMILDIKNKSNVEV